MNRKPLLFELSGLWYAYAGGGQHALALEHLELHEGECVAFTGGNGSGKTTLLKLLNYLLPSQDDRRHCGGSLLFRGEPYSRHKARGYSIYMLQQPYMLPGTVAQNVAVGTGSLFRHNPILKKKIEEALCYVGLADKAERLARALSGGEAQRLALARVIAANRDVLLLDEPTASVDRVSAERIEEILRTLKGRTTILFSTHSHRFAERLADRIIELSNGTLMSDRRNSSAHERTS